MDKTEMQVKIDQLLAEANLTKRRSGSRDIDLSGQEPILTTTDELFLEEIKKEAASTDLAENELVRIQERAQTRGFSFLLVGRTGVGKSSTINSLMGREIAPVGKFEAETKVVKAYPAPPEAIIPYRIYDTPGLCDADGDNKEYLKLIHREIKEPIDCLWFVTQLDDTRVRTDEIDTISHITSAFGQDIWNRAVIVFTRSDKVDPQDFENDLAERTRLIRDEIAKKVGKEIAIEIPSVAVSNVSQKTPDGKLWLGRLFVRTFIRISKEGLDGFLLEIVNWRGLYVETGKAEGVKSSNQGTHVHYHNTEYNETNIHNHPPIIEVNLDDEPKPIRDIFEKRAKTWLGEKCSQLGEIGGYRIAKELVGERWAEYGAQLGKDIGADIGDAVTHTVNKTVKVVGEVVQKTERLFRNVGNAFSSFFR